MQFFLAAGILALISTALLLYQFWTSALDAESADAGTTPEPLGAEAEPRIELKAA
jgi:hypothetical protein